MVEWCGDGVSNRADSGLCPAGLGSSGNFMQPDTDLSDSYYTETGCAEDSRQIVHKLWRKGHDDMSRLSGGWVLVLCEGQRKPHLQYLRNIYERDTEFSVTGFWVDGTKNVDDRLSVDFHKMGSVHISEITGVRLVESPSSKATHNRLDSLNLRFW